MFFSGRKAIMRVCRSCSHTYLGSPRRCWVCGARTSRPVNGALMLWGMIGCILPRQIDLVSCWQGRGVHLPLFLLRYCPPKAVKSQADKMGTLSLLLLPVALHHRFPELPLALYIVLHDHLNNPILLGNDRFNLLAREPPWLLSFCQRAEHRVLIQKLALGDLNGGGSERVHHKRIATPGGD